MPYRMAFGMTMTDDDQQTKNADEAVQLPDLIQRQLVMLRPDWT